GPMSALTNVSVRRGSPAIAFTLASWSRRATVRLSTMNSTSNPGSRISSSILMTSSSWHRATHRMTVPTDDYTLRRDPSGVECEEDGRLVTGRRSANRPRTLASPLLVFFVLLVSFVSFVSFVCAQQVPVFRGGVDLVHIGVTVIDRKGNLVTGLKAEDF